MAYNWDIIDHHGRLEAALNEPVDSYLKANVKLKW